ncbi:TPA: bifunctional acetate--CoA ligase family protein/GNAT family N-acetyltransferase [Candidatus Woesearchaeota archaeon]|nr:bifunctional acetate--CoA ligase family protein/GNAT family N-acetyltransferase [Candidatus Woesearchaeota archaeon]
MATNSLDKLFNPKSIAVIGASSTERTVGHALMKNLVGSGYAGVVYPVNPKHEHVFEMRAYPSVAGVPEQVELAIIATPASTVPAIIDECHAAKITAAVVISAGFSEAGEEGKALSGLVGVKAKEYGMRILGPNCLGFVRPHLKLNASFAGQALLPGKIAFISQSGALGTAILDWASKNNVGFSGFVSLGTMVDVGFHDLIDYFGKDQHTQSILLYMESLQDARKFLSAARAFSKTKPIIVLKVGRSEAGAKAAKSHTGSLTGDDAVYDAAFKRAGIVRVASIGELFDTAKSLSMQDRPKGNKVAIVTNAGGPGVIATDALIAGGGELARFSDATRLALDAALPPAWSHGNPVDILGDASPERYKAAVGACLHELEVDGVIVILTPQDMTDPTGVAEELVSLKNPEGKTLLCVWMGEDAVAEGRNILVRGNIPAYRTPENAVRCFMAMWRYTKGIELLYQTPGSIPHAFTPKTEENKELVRMVYAQGRTQMHEAEARQFLSNYALPVASYHVVRRSEEVKESAEQVGFPLAMKVLSPDILHKSDVGGVVLSIQSAEEAQQAYDSIMKAVSEKAHGARIEGVLIERMVAKRYEILIGCKKDTLFGPVIVFGMGGLAVEVFRDVNVGLPPLNMALAQRLIEETTIFKLLKGYRNMPGIDIDALKFVLYKFAYLLADFPQVKEIDVNPFAVDEHGGVIVDAKVILDERMRDVEVAPYSHLVIMPYPKGLETTIVLKDGRTAMLRPIRPEDEPLEAEMLTHFSKETQRFRLFHTIEAITHEFLIKYTQIDYDREIAIIAEVEGKMAGVVRLIADADNGTGEFAVAVADPWQRLGLGNKFTDYMLDIARRRGIKKVFATVLPDNYVMLHMLSSRRFSFQAEEGFMKCELSLG